MSNEYASGTGHDSLPVQLWKRYAKAFFMFALLVFIVLLLTASTRMVTVAMRSQPDCVQHYKAVDDKGASYLAAKSSC